MQVGKVMLHIIEVHRFVPTMIQEDGDAEPNAKYQQGKVGGSTVLWRSEETIYFHTRSFR
jgi:hypothetical protein